MTEAEPRPFQLRVHVCRRGRDWEFFAENADSRPCDRLELESVTYIWGPSGKREETRREFGALAPGRHVRIWVDDEDAAEINVDLALVVLAGGKRFRGVLELPKLYRLGRASRIESLDRAGHSFTEELRHQRESTESEGA